MQQCWQYTVLRVLQDTVLLKSAPELLNLLMEVQPLVACCATRDKLLRLQHCLMTDPNCTQCSLKP